MAVQVTYRGYICTGGYNQGYSNPNKGDMNLTPQVISERIFGDFPSEYELTNSYRKWLTSWIKKNEGENLPTLKIVEVFINN